MKRIIVLSLVLLAAIACGDRGNEPTFSNPVIRGDIPDPSVIRIDDTYYLAGTSSEWAPHYPIFKSRDLVNWETAGHVFDRKPEWTSSSFWAPELLLHNGTVFCYYTARRASDNISCIGVATSENPEEGFTDHGLIVEHGREAIDAFVYDDEGQLYITWKAYGLEDRPIEIVGCRISADGLRLEGEPFSMLVDEERIGMEGQYIFREGGYYYMVYAARGCCGPGSDYEVRVARAESFEGPYEKYEGNPILKGGEEFMSCGHGTGVRTPDGRHFFICHSYMHGDGFFQGRQPLLQEIRVGEDGWVHFTCGENASSTLPVPFRGRLQNAPEDFSDEFEDDGLKDEWSWNYIFADVSAHTENGRLHLGGQALYEDFNGVALCLRPQSSSYRYQARVFRPESGSAGLTMYGGNSDMLAWGYRDGRLVLEVFKDKGHDILFSRELEGDSAYLMIEVRNGRNCRCFWSADGAEWHHAETPGIDSRSMTQWDRVSRPGLRYLGPDTSHAEFDSFTLKNL